MQQEQARVAVRVLLWCTSVFTGPAHPLAGAAVKTPQGGGSHHPSTIELFIYFSFAWFDMIS
jgi:hypothetical protein